MTISPELAAKVVGIAVAIGVLLPLLQALLQKPWWSSRTKSILTVVLAVIGGAAGYVVTNGVDFSDPAKIALWIVGAYTAATTLYARLLRPLGVTDAIEHGVNATPPANTQNPYGEPEVEDGPDESGAASQLDADEAPDDGAEPDGGKYAYVDADDDNHDDTTGQVIPKG